jgi:tRNA-binding protein
MRVDTIINAEIFKNVKNPAYKLTIDFGELGIKKSSAQITNLYTSSNLID